MQDIDSTKTLKVVRTFNGIIHYVNKDTIIASKRNKLFISCDNGEHFSFLFKVPFSLREHLLSYLMPLRRLFRLGIKHVNLINSENIIIVANKKIYYCNLSTKKCVSNNIVGSNPLNICVSNKKEIYYGEYRGNQERSNIHIFKSSDLNKSWKIVWTFQNVRHIHGVFQDPYTNAFWVTTGDADNESGIWVSYDEFKSIKKIYGNSQQVRAINLVFTKDLIYFGSDTPSEKNHIYCFSRDNFELENLIEVDNSVFFGCKSGENIFFSTAVEPSEVNKSQKASLWACTDKKNFRCVFSYKKDIFPKKLFQYGQIILPLGEGREGYLWYTPMNTKYNQISVLCKVVCT